MAKRKFTVHLVRFLLIAFVAMAAVGCYRVREDGDDVVIGFSVTVILVVIAVPTVVATIGLLLCRNEEYRPKGLFTVLATAMISLLIVPSICLDTVRITDEEISQKTGFWLSPKRNGFRYDEVLFVQVTEVEKEHTVETLWTVHFRNGKTRTIDPGDLWDHAAVEVVDELRARGVDVRVPLF